MERTPFVTQSNYYDEEAQDFQDPKIERAIRHGFIKKVYGILVAQLLITTAIGGFFTCYEPARTWITDHGTPLLITSAIMAIVLICVLSCIPSMSKSYPANYIILLAFTLFESIAIGGVCGFTSATQTNGSTIVLQALICTAVAVVGLTLFAFQTKYDFVSWAGGLFVVLLGLSVFGFTRLFFPQSAIIETIYAASLALVFSLYILIDTQLLIGRKKFGLSTDDYILAAVSLYLDVINLFLQILRLLQLLSRSRD